MSGVNEDAGVRIGPLCVWDRNGRHALEAVWDTRVVANLCHHGPPHVPYVSIDVSISLDYPDKVTRDWVLAELEAGKKEAVQYTLTWTPGHEHAALVRDRDGLDMGAARLVPAGAEPTQG